MATTTEFAAALYQAAESAGFGEELGSFLDQVTLACEDQDPAVLAEFVSRCRPQLADLSRQYLDGKSAFTDELHPLMEELGLESELHSFLQQLTLACRNSDPSVLTEFVSRCRPQLVRLGAAYREAQSTMGNLLLARVVTAKPLDEARRSQMEEALSRRFRKHVICRFSVDESLLGGAVTYIDHRVIDGSLRRRLESLHSQLLADEVG